MDPNGDGDPSDGIDGWRLDVANEVPTGFWRDWHALARKINPQCYTVAEIWDDAQRFLDEGQFSATMNYFGFSFPVKGFLIDETLAPSGAARLFDERRQGFPLANQYALQNLMDSHDTDRLASMIVNAGRRPYKEPNRFDYDIGVSPRYVSDYDVRQAERSRAARAAAGRAVADDVRRRADDLLRHRGRHVGRRRSVRPDADGLAGDVVRSAAGRSAGPAAAGESGGVRRWAVQVLSGGDQVSTRQSRAAARRLEFVATDDQAEFLAFRRSDATDTLLVGLNRGGKPFKWNVPLATGETASQVFTASGEVDQVYDRAEGRGDDRHRAGGRWRCAAGVVQEVKWPRMAISLESGTSRCSKTFAIGLLALLAASFAGCGKRDSRTVITIWHQSRPAEYELLKDEIARFEAAHPKVRVRALYKETEELRSGFQAAALAGGGPELIYGPSDVLGTLQTMGVVQDMSPWFPERMRDDFVDGALTYLPSTARSVEERAGAGGRPIRNHLALVYNRRFIQGAAEDDR